MGLEQIVNVQITRQTQGVSQAGFGIPLILGASPSFSGVREYSSAAAAALDLSTSSAEYGKIVKIFSQTPKPKKVMVKKTSTPVVQVVTFAVNVTGLSAPTAFKVTLDLVDYTFTSDADPTQAEVVAGLIALINADSNAKMTASGTTSLVCTADTAGIGFSYEGDSRTVPTLTTANVGIATDILEAMQQNKGWYAVLLASSTVSTIMEAAKTIESVRRIFLPLSADADIRTSVTTDVASLLKTKSYFRTALYYTATLTDHLEAGVAGRFLPTNPGSETWYAKTIAGVTVDSWNDTEQSVLEGKNVNYYVSVADKPIVMGAKVAGGEWIDIIRFIDWMQARMEERVFSAITRLDKIPYTDGGIGIVTTELDSVLVEGQRVGGVAPTSVDSEGNIIPGYTITAPKAAEVPFNDKAARRLTGVSFEAKLSGAIHAADINGVATL